MADTIINRNDSEPTERVVERRGSSLGVIIAIIVGILLLLALFGGGLFRTGTTGGGSGTNAPVNVGGGSGSGAGTGTQ